MFNLQHVNWHPFLYVFWHWLTLKSIRQRYAQHKGFLVTLTEHQKVGWRLIKLQETGIAESDFTLMKLAPLQVVSTLLGCIQSKFHTGWPVWAPKKMSPQEKQKVKLLTLAFLFLKSKFNESPKDFSINYPYNNKCEKMIFSL